MHDLKSTAVYPLLDRDYLCGTNWDIHFMVNLHPKKEGEGDETHVPCKAFMTLNSILSISKCSRLDPSDSLTYRQ